MWCPVISRTKWKWICLEQHPFRARCLAFSAPYPRTKVRVFSTLSFWRTAASCWIELIWTDNCFICGGIIQNHISSVLFICPPVQGDNMGKPNYYYIFSPWIYRVLLRIYFPPSLPPSRMQSFVVLKFLFDSIGPKEFVLINKILKYFVDKSS